MYEMELSTSAFGQGFNCTMIQEISAMAAAINGGIYYQPHLVKEITDEDGKGGFTGPCGFRSGGCNAGDGFFCQSFH